MTPRQQQTTCKVKMSRVIIVTEKCHRCKCVVTEDDERFWCDGECDWVCNDCVPSHKDDKRCDHDGCDCCHPEGCERELCDDEPLEKMTCKNLKDILRKMEMKVSGTKKELIARIQSGK